MSTYTNQYPPSQNSTYVKSTTQYSADYVPYNATDPAKSLTGSWLGNSWISVSGTITNQRFHIDLGEAKIIRRIYYENNHHWGATYNYSPYGSRHYSLQGSNEASAFAELTYATDTDWTSLQTGLEFDIHVNNDVANPKYQTINNTVAYRYYAFKIADNWEGATLVGIRRLVLQTEDGYPPNTVLVINNATHALDSDNLTLTTEGGEDISLMIASALHTLSSDNLVLSQAHILAIQNAIHTLTSDNISFSGGVQVAGAAPFTVHEMEHFIRTILNEPSTAILSSAEILNALNDGYKDVSRLAFCIENYRMPSTAAGSSLVSHDAYRVNQVYFGNVEFAGGGNNGSLRATCRQDGGISAPSTPGGGFIPGWMDNMCLTSHIEYITLGMDVNEVQTLMVGDFISWVSYTWTISLGSLSASTGVQVDFTAPATNPECALAVIKLYVGTILCDTISISVNAVVSGFAYLVQDAESLLMEHDAPEMPTSSYVCGGTPDICSCSMWMSWYTCDGSRYDNYHEYLWCPNYDGPQHELTQAPCWGHPERDYTALMTYLDCGLYGHYYDKRTAGMITAGCCPSVLV